MRREPPKEIYLQWEGVDKSEINILPSADPDRGDITWCQDKIFDTDIRYVIDKRYKRRTAQ